MTFLRCHEHLWGSRTQVPGQKVVGGWQVCGLKLEAPCSTFSPRKMLAYSWGGTQWSGPAACGEKRSGNSEPVHTKWTRTWCQRRRNVTDTSSFNPHNHLVRWGLVRFLFIEEEAGLRVKNCWALRSQAVTGVVGTRMQVFSPKDEGSFHCLLCLAWSLNMPHG